MQANEERNWKDHLNERLPLYGHRNWIVVADAAYPWQTAPGIETISTGSDQIEVIKWVLDAVETASHVRPVIYLDAELPYLEENDASGIENYRAELNSITQGRTIRQIPHEAIISQLDTAGRAFKILLLKTTLTLPYTSLFIELDCGYWSPEAEHRLRTAFQTQKI